MIIIGRPINGISLNGLEYLLDSKRENTLTFEDKKEAQEFLTTHDVKEEDLEDDFVYVEVGIETKGRLFKIEDGSLI